MEALAIVGLRDLLHVNMVREELRAMGLDA
jgi:hypothetical protein